MSKKQTIAVIMGGRSAEHEVSLLSARNIIKALDKNKYDVVPIGIDPSGLWHHLTGDDIFLRPTDPENIALGNQKDQVHLQKHGENQIIATNKSKDLHPKIDVVFPILHGTYGEDGTLQGFLEMHDVAYVGPDVLSSAMCFDKDITKKILRAQDIAVAKGITLKSHEELPQFAILARDIGTPLFIKPANAGSSVGVSKVETSEQYEKAIVEAFCYDNKILIEEAIIGRELECAVKGTENPEASVIGEIIVMGDHAFYSYDSKYLDADGAEAVVPANITKGESEKLRETAIKAYKALDCSIMARVDMFLTPAGEIYVNEINTIPGFTDISMYPKLWEATGEKQTKLLDDLINYATDRHQKKSALRTIK